MDYTPRLNLPKPLGNENVNRQAYRDLIDAIDAGAETPSGAQAKVDAAIAALLSGAPGALDTLNELATALGDDPNFATTIINSLGTKVNQTDFNAHLADNVPHSTKSNLTYYINVASGNDANDGLSSGTALKTITAAINKLPPRINHIVTINVATGTYNETVTIAGFIGSGEIDIMAGASASTNYTVNNVVIIGCTIKIYTRGLNASTSSSDSFYISDCLFARCDYCNATVTDSSHSGFYILQSLAQVTNSVSSNKANGIYNINSNVTSQNNSGTGNTYGLQCVFAGTIGKSGPQPGGATAETTSGGGLIR